MSRKWPVKPQSSTTCLSCNCRRCTFNSSTCPVQIFTLCLTSMFCACVPRSFMSISACVSVCLQRCVELKKLMKDQKEQTYWQETGRWAGYEESYDPQSGVWASSSITYLTFKSLIQLRRTMNTGQRGISET